MSARDGVTPVPPPEGTVEATAGPLPVSRPGSGPAVAPEMDDAAQRLDITLNGVRAWLHGVDGDMPTSQQLISEWVVGSRLMAAGRSEAALRCLLPLQQPLEQRLPVMVTVGAIVTGTLCDADPAAGTVTSELAMAGAQLDRTAIRDLIAAACGEHVLIDALAGLLARYAAWEATR